jgi:glycogen debranching enzyme
VAEDRWSSTGDVPRLHGEHGTLTVVDGTSFCLSDPDGSIVPYRPSGLFVGDVRVLSGFQLSVNGQVPELLASTVYEPFRADIVCRVPAPTPSGPTDGGSWLVLRRLRRVSGPTLHEDVTIDNFGPTAQQVDVSATFDADFASLFDVKLGHAAPDPSDIRRLASDSTLHFGSETSERLVVVESSGAETDEGASILSWRVEIPGRGRWTTAIDVHVPARAATPGTIHSTGFELRGDQRWAAWERTVPKLEVGHAALQRAYNQGVDDLGALRVFDPTDPTRAVIAAGAPWFMALFGRDSLLASWMSLPLGTDLALDVLETLARLQGTKLDPLTEEQPGRILHEVRFDKAPSPALEGGDIYFGTADATPLFVMLLGEVMRWGADPDRVRALLPAADRALEWVRKFGDADGDGFVEYEAMSPHGLRNQGWKDSWDGVTFADGRPAEPPIAMCEVQAYTVAALRARAQLAADFGDPSQSWLDESEWRQARFEEAFWLPHLGYYALALDGDKQPVDSLASNLGHLLWCGTVDAERAGLIASKLVRPEMFSGWGVRSLATTMAAYDPLSYHNGSVWPHDTAIAIAGLARYGFDNAARRVSLALLDAASAHDGRLPELFSGIDRSEVAVPVDYPTSCSPQAWAAAAPFLLLRVLLGLEPDVPSGRVAARPIAPDSFGKVELRGLPLGAGRVDLQWAAGRLTMFDAERKLSLVTR